MAEVCHEGFLLAQRFFLRREVLNGDQEKRFCGKGDGLPTNPLRVSQRAIRKSQPNAILTGLDRQRQVRMQAVGACQHGRGLIQQRGDVLQMPADQLDRDTIDQQRRCSLIRPKWRGWSR